MENGERTNKTTKRCKPDRERQVRLERGRRGRMRWRERTHGCTGDAHPDAVMHTSTRGSSGIGVWDEDLP